MIDKEQKHYSMNCFIMHGYLGIHTKLFFSLVILWNILFSCDVCMNLFAEGTYPHFPMSKELDTVMSKNRLTPSAPFLRLGAQETRFG